MKYAYLGLEFACDDSTGDVLIETFSLTLIIFFTACDNEEQTAEEFFQKVRQCHTLTLYFRLISAL